MNSAPPVGPPIPPSVIPFSQDQCINFIGFLFIQNQGPVKTLKSQSPFSEINYYHAQYHSRWEEGIILTNPFQCYLSVFVFRCVYECLFVCLCVCMCVCVCVCGVCFVYLHHFYQYYLCLTGRTQSCNACNQQIHGFYKWIIFKKKRHCEK